MNKTIALVLLQKLSGETSLDRVSGIVQVLRRPVQIAEDGPIIEKRIPYAHDASPNDLATMAKAMIPNSAYKSCLYFEDGGIQSVTPVRRGWQFESRMRLVCWLNMLKVHGAYDTFQSSLIMAKIIRRVTVENYHDSFFSRLNCSVIGLPVQDAAIFAPYDYDEAHTQFLMPPFDFFALDLSCSFWIANECLDRINSGLDYITDQNGDVLKDQSGQPLIA